MKIKLLLFTALLSAAILAGCSQTTEDSTLSKETVINNKVEDNKEATDTEITINNLKENEIAFAENGYFYSENLEVEIVSSKACKIYYTTDGKNPDQEKKLYNNAITLNAGSEVKATCIKAKAYYEDGTESDTIVHTYFVGKNVNDRFDTLVFSVTTDPYNLYDDVYGIFVEGKLRRDYIKENPNDKIEPNDPANYNMRGKDSEREIYLEILEPDGTRITNQAAGIRTYGGWSRANLQKSIKIFARKEYDQENNKLRYEFFPFKTAANGNGNKVDTFKQLVLRNCGNDSGFAFIRDELFQTLARQAGYIDNEAVRPVTLFVNGTYQGFYWLHEVYCDEYFEDNYGKYNGTFEILEGGENFKILAEDESNQQIIRDYEDMYYTYSGMDLTNDANFKKLSEQVDVENYLSYYALQIYIGNEDWPHNNYKTYRYYTKEGEAYREAPFDGKWRYLFHDLDFSFGIYGNGPLNDNIGNYIGPNGEIRDTCPLFGRLLQREDCREIFIKKTLDLINGAFAPDNINDVLTAMNASRLNELNQMYGKNLIADWVQPDHLPGRLQDIRNYGAQRADHILTKYQQYFDMGDIYMLSVQPAEGGKVKVNSYLTDEYFVGSYYSNYKTVILPVLEKGDMFDYWLVNGNKVEQEELIITSGNILNGNVEVTCVVK
jgi:hypothetical protein